MRTVLVRRLAMALTGALMLATTACGGDAGPRASGSRPHIVVTTSILGDVVRNLVGEAAGVQVIMPPGADPHDFAPSAREAVAMRDADLLVVNGLGFEAALLDTIHAAERDGTTLITATDEVDLIGADPHFFTDPARMRAAAAQIADELAAHLSGLDSTAYRTRVDHYLSALDDLDREVSTILAAVPAGHRALVTNHEVFAYFADRYGFEVLGAVVPSGTTLAEPSASGLHHLANAIAETGVPAIFAETSSPARLAKALAAEGRGVEVVSLYSESLGASGSDGSTYLEMVRTNARRIAAALG